MEELKDINNSCIPAIIAQLPAKCTMINISSYEDIDYISYGKLYVQPKNQPITYTSNCKQTTQNIKIPTLIEFNNCTITINNQQYSTSEKEIQTNYEIEIPYNEIYIEKVKPELTLEKLHNQTIQNMEAVNLVHNHSRLHTSSGHLSLSIIIICIISIIIYKIFIWRKTIVKITPVPLLRPDVHLRGEESRIPLQDITINKPLS